MNEKLKALRIRVITAAVAAGPVMAMAAEVASPEAGITDAIAKVLLIVAAGGAGYITISLAGVGWSVGAKFIKRLAGKS
ncbi:hypothetical protein [Comamonas sp.]|uniref:hypothetical protein n=1 Tax=Comamonas sp. TaxID=34028 RepID=UPI003A91DF99